MKIVYILLASIFASIQLSGQWTQLNSGSTAWLRGVWFINNNEGVAVGYNGTILRTVNSGDSWEKIESNTDNHLFSVLRSGEAVSSVESADTFSVQIFPNPTLDFLMIKGDAALSHELFYTLSDLKGMNLQNGKVVENEIIDIRGLENNMYLLTLNDDGLRKTFKIVKK